jgi:hypothetical protein
LPVGDPVQDMQVVAEQVDIEQTLDLQLLLVLQLQ